MSSSSEVGYTRSEILAALTARLLEDRKTVFVGVGVPMLAAALAKSLHAPHIVIFFEGGIIDPELKTGFLPLSTNEVRAARRAVALPPINEVFFYQQRGFIDYAIIGGAQVDKYGNVNTSIIGTPDNLKVRLPGSGGANDIASSCSKIIISTLLEKRRFVEKVDFITSPGYLYGGDTRTRSGLILGQPFKVVTDMAVFDFDPVTKLLRLESILEGVSVETVLENMSFKPLVHDNITTIKPPSTNELEILRRLDVHRQILR